MSKETFLPCYRCGSNKGLMVLKSGKIPCSCGGEYREFFVRCTLCSKPLNNNEGAVKPKLKEAIAAWNNIQNLMKKE